MGGTIIVNNTWKIGIQNPFKNKFSIRKILYLQSKAISTSGIYFNFYKLNSNYIFHILDPRTGFPIKNNIGSVTIITPTALEADSWDTGLMILGVKKTQKIAIKEKLSVYIIFKYNGKNIGWMSPYFIKFNSFVYKK